VKQKKQKKNEERHEKQCNADQSHPIQPTHPSTSTQSMLPNHKNLPIYRSYIPFPHDPIHQIHLCCKNISIIRKYHHHHHLKKKDKGKVNRYLNQKQRLLDDFDENEEKQWGA